MKQMKLCVMILFFTTVYIIPASTLANDNPYQDVSPNDDHYEGIMWVTQKGLQGYEDGTYRANTHLTRTHAALFFTRVLDLSMPDKSVGASLFNDIPEDYLYGEFIGAVGQEGIFSGSNGAFMPDNRMTREQMATTLVQAFDLEKNLENVPVRLDNVEPSHKENVQILANNGVTVELDDFRPKDTVTRGQFATFLYQSHRAEQGLNEPPTSDPEPEPEPETTPEPEPKPEPEPAPSPGGKNLNYETKNYNINFADAVDMQMRVAPQTDSRWVWYNAGESLVAYFMNPTNFTKGTQNYFQFLKLSGATGLDADELNSTILNGKGVLEGTGEYFIEASNKYDVNEIYLIAHSLLETGNGNSELATGIEVNGKTTYNMFGIGARDACPKECGSQYAYNNGWFSPREAIIGGAAFIGQGYVHSGQDTLYKMRWNPQSLVSNGYASHQYATDVGWAVKQTRVIYELYEQLNNYSATFEVPEYKNQPAATKRPYGDAEFAVNRSNQGESYTTTANLNMRVAPSTEYNVITTLPKGTVVETIGHNRGWYKVKGNGHTGWVSSAYLK